MRKKWRFALLTLLFAGVFIPALFSSCIGYLVRAGQGQMEILWRRQPIQEILLDPETPTTLREKLQLVQDVQTFSKEKLGLNVDDSYKSYSKIDREAAAWNVTASRELSFEPKTWWFPVVGRVPYLGFFTREEAEELSEELKREGWETAISEVSAYSTLGWFDDPLLSSQLHYSDWHLASLVIHESAHATIWFTGDVDFNESFATFVEEQGVREFFNQSSVPREKVDRWIRTMEEYEIISSIIRKSAGNLSEIYQSSLPDELKREKKRQEIEKMKESMLQAQSRFRVIRVDPYIKKQYNNAHFRSYLRYNSGQGYFLEQFEICNGEWECFFKKMRSLENLSRESRQELLVQGSHRQ